MQAETEDNSPQEENMEALLKDPGLDGGEGEGDSQGVDPAQEESPDQSISSAMPIEADAPMVQDGNCDNISSYI